MSETTEQDRELLDSAKDAYQKALATVLNYHPYFSHALYALSEVYVDSETTELETLAADKWWRIYINPRGIVQMPILEVAASLVIEIHRLMYMHFDRRGSRFVDAWGMASTLEVAQRLDIPCRLPLTPDEYDLDTNLIAEEYYELLLELGIAGPTFEDFLPSPITGKGGSAMGAEGDWELPPTDGEVLTPSEALHLSQITQGQKGYGLYSGDLDRRVAVGEDPGINWRTQVTHVLNGIVSASGVPSDYSYSRRSPLQDMNSSVLLPGYMGEEIDPLFIIDTSASVNNAALEKALGSVNGFLKGIGHSTGVRVMAADAAVKACRRVLTVGRVELKGGGGTRMDLAIREGAELLPPPSFIICYTDGYSPWPKQPVMVPLVVLLCDKNGKGKIPYWAKTILIE